MTAGVPTASHLSFLGLSLDRFRSLLTASTNTGATSITVANASGWTSTGFITFYDPASAGAATETVAYSAVSGNTVTCSATSSAHPAGTLVVVTAAGAAPTTYVPVKKLEPADNVTILEDEGYRGSEVTTYGAVPGVVHAEYSTEGDVFSESFPFWLGAILGDYTTSGASAPFTHSFAIKNNASGNYGGGQPKSLTLVDPSGLPASGKARAYPGMLVSELGLKFNSEELLTYDVKLTGFPSGLVNTPTASWTSTTVPTASWVGAVSIGGTGVLYVQSGEISMKRNVTVLQTVDGSTTPYGIWLGPLEVSGKLTFIASDETELVRYLTVATPALVCNWTQGSGSSLTQVQATMSKVNYSGTKVGRGDDYVNVETDFKAHGNTTDVGSSGGYSPIRWVVQNSVNGSTTPYA